MEQRNDGVLAPISPTERLGEMDFLRGLALFGILMVNLPLFGFPIMIGFGSPELASGPAADRVAWWIGSVGFQWSFISLFSLLFGAGFVMMSMRAESRGSSVVGPYLRRCAMLICFGLLHVTLLWMGDILFAYGILGLILLPLGWVRAGTLAIVGIVLIIVASVLTGGFTVLTVLLESLAASANEVAEANGSPDAADQLRGFEAMVAAQFDPGDPVWIDAETAAHVEGPFLTAMLFRLMLWAFSVLSGVFTYAWHVLGFFCLGAALMKAGFFDRRDETSETAARWRRLETAMLVAAPVGLLLKAAHALVMHMNGWEMTIAASLATILQMLGASMLTLGLVAAGCRLVRSGVAGAATRWVMAAGRMPLTLYLMQSVICVAIMDHWGLARFGQVDRVSMIGLTIAIWIGQVIFANLWFRAFRIGPLEWIWRFGTYLRWPRVAA